MFRGLDDRQEGQWRSVGGSVGYLTGVIVNKDGSDTENSSPARNSWRDSLGQIGTGQVIIVAISFVAPIFVIAIFAPFQPKPGQTIAVGLMIEAASITSGAAIGFLFALPRSITISVPMGTERPSRGLTVRPNTNLEEVSDWLTKIIVGLTLTQLGKIPSAAAHLFTVLGRALGTLPESVIFAGCLVIYAFIIGLVNAWLATRIYIEQWMEGSDAATQAATVEAARLNDPELERAIAQASLAKTSTEEK